MFTSRLLSVIIPCFNEASTIEQIVRAVAKVQLPKGWRKEIIVVDDGSAAQTRDALRRIETTQVPDEEVPLTVISKEKNEGKGSAIKAGLRRVRGEYIIIQDADLEYDPNDYAALLAPIVDGRANSVFGSRTLQDNNVPYSAIYFYGGLLVTKLFNLAFGTHLTDIATCYKVFSRKHIPALLASPHQDFVFDAMDITHVLATSGTVLEVPVRYSARTKAGGKKLSWKHGAKIVFAILKKRLTL